MSVMNMEISHRESEVIKGLIGRLRCREFILFKNMRRTLFSSKDISKGFNAFNKTLLAFYAVGTDFPGLTYDCRIWSFGNESRLSRLYLDS